MISLLFIISLMMCLLGVCKAQLSIIANGGVYISFCHSFERDSKHVSFNLNINIPLP